MKKLKTKFSNGEQYEIDYDVLINLLKNKNGWKWVQKNNEYSFMSQCRVFIKWDDIKDKVKRLELNKIKCYESEWRNCEYEIQEDKGI